METIPTFAGISLGSSTGLTDAGGGLVDDIVRYAPFGEVRGGTLPTNITDRGFTGHKHNVEIGLICMNARFYVPSIGRFASADTLVPDPANPQQFNRYTYSLNSPLNYSDPTGHCAENGDETCWGLVEQIMRMFPDYPFVGTLPQLSEAELWDILIDVSDYPSMKESNPIILTEEEIKLQLEQAVGSNDYTVASLDITPYGGSIYVDDFGNVYVNRHVVSTPGGSLLRGDINFLDEKGKLKDIDELPMNEQEAAVQNALPGVSGGISGGFWLGGGVWSNSGPPKYVVYEWGIYSPGVASNIGKTWLIYDNGSESPWFPDLQ